VVGDRERVNWGRAKEWGDGRRGSRWGSGDEGGWERWGGGGGVEGA